MGGGQPTNLAYFFKALVGWYAREACGRKCDLREWESNKMRWIPSTLICSFRQKNTPSPLSLIFLRPTFTHQEQRNSPPSLSIVEESSNKKEALGKSLSSKSVQKLEERLGA
ncbi:unnamed protein product [Cuscuta epithymum]|uniref:Uncharacterized protein n=1 Tax=Cuscuta epithymum TaxID=186058 RepID=A0AAV0FV61_9ASTE|nr:unnamed protein product [Cuscuta epithymum]